MNGKKLIVAAAFCVSVFSLSMTANAKGNVEEKIEAGIFVDDIDLSGKTVSEAKSAVQAYVDSFGDTQITLHAVDGQTITATAADFGIRWTNQGIIDEAAGLGKDGNIVQCYKALKDLEYANRIYNVVLDFDRSKIKALIEEQGAQYSQEAVDATLVKNGDNFQITEGQTGIEVDTNASVEAVYNYLIDDWKGEVGDVDLVIEVVEPRGKAEDLAKVKDVLGTFTTSFSTSNSSRSANVTNGCELINGCTLYPGDEFSAYEEVAPFTQANGYYMAGSYLNGQVVDSLGGGICQVSTTLYNAVLNAELEVTERYNHSMIVTYVDPSADAAIAESSGKDFKFVNNTGYPIYIEGSTTSDKRITFTIYGVETRDPNRKVTYESVVLETNVPETEVIYTNASLPVGYCSVQSAHIGYRAQLWKVVTVDGKEVSREQINSSTYNKAPRSATVGVATEDPAIYEAMMAAIATNSIDQVKAVAASFLPAPEPTGEEVPAAEVPAEPAPMPEESSENTEI